jgi:16S rRNA (cytosine967-C5)-methyltransferase
MTPAARIAASIDVLDAVGSGKPTEQALTAWGRANRYAGSKDRAAVRDHVFDAVRNLRLFAALGGATSGRGLMLGSLMDKDVDPATVFTGEGYAPPALTSDEWPRETPDMTPAIAGNLPDWVYQKLSAQLGDQVDQTAKLLSQRAPLGLRVNTLKSTLSIVSNALEKKGIEINATPLSETALLVDGAVRGLRNMPAFLDGWFEFQDAASQALVDAIPLVKGDRVLDYCAGGGGKTLSLAARLEGIVHAHDANPERMKDLPERARRAGASVEIGEPEGLFDVVLCDVPCSGSGAWRRAPDGKWALTQDSLNELTKLQDDILETATGLVVPDGVLVYATCSIFNDENEERMTGFLNRHPDWKMTFEQRFDVSPDNDGFYTAHLQRA